MSNSTVPENDDGLEQSYMLQDTSGKEGSSSDVEIILKAKELWEELRKKLLKNTSEVGEGGSNINCAPDGTCQSCHGLFDEHTHRIAMELCHMLKERGVYWQEEQQVVPEDQAGVNSEQPGTSMTLLDDTYFNKTLVERPTSHSVEESTVLRNSDSNVGRSTKTCENERLLTSTDDSISEAGTPKRKSDDSADPESSSGIQSFPKKTKLEAESQAHSNDLRDIEDPSGSITSSSKDPKDVEIASLKKLIRKLQAIIQCLKNRQQMALRSLNETIPLPLV